MLGGNVMGWHMLLARQASSTPFMSVWMEEISPELNSIYMADLNGLS